MFQLCEILGGKLLDTPLVTLSNLSINLRSGVINYNYPLWEGILGAGARGDRGQMMALFDCTGHRTERKDHLVNKNGVVAVNEQMMVTQGQCDKG